MRWALAPVALASRPQFLDLEPQVAVLGFERRHARGRDRDFAEAPARMPPITAPCEGPEIPRGCSSSDVSNVQTLARGEQAGLTIKAVFCRIARAQHGTSPLQRLTYWLQFE